MSIKKATLSDLNKVYMISKNTISEIYPHYYPKGAVEFFLEHHREENIANDILCGQVFLCYDKGQNPTGTVTIKGNEICRLFVLPECQGYGYGKEMLDFAEASISGGYPEILLDASLPAKKIYQKRGYQATEFHVIATNHKDFLCYDVMVRPVE